MGAESQGFGPSSTAFPGHKQGAGWEAGSLALEQVTIWDSGMCKARTLNTITLGLRSDQESFQRLLQLKNIEQDPEVLVTSFQQKINTQRCSKSVSV